MRLKGLGTTIPFIATLILSFASVSSARVSDTELRRGVAIMNKHYPKTLPSGRSRVERAYVRNGTIATKFTVLIPGNIADLKKIFHADVIVRSKSPNILKLINEQGYVYYDYYNKSGKLLFSFKITPTDLRRK
tara:strand:+ start:822 stop:1220 length:399 start_codon:yes stop_codon:yes gene_type:complete